MLTLKPLRPQPFSALNKPALTMSIGRPTPILFRGGNHRAAATILSAFPASDFFSSEFS